VPLARHVADARAEPHPPRHAHPDRDRVRRSCRPAIAGDRGCARCD
jgi:hypothetical protein